MAQRLAVNKDIHRTPYTRDPTSDVTPHGPLMASNFSPPKNTDVDDLLLDSKNPRIPIDKQSFSPEKLLAYVATTYNSIAIARSITAHDYFPSEPLIAIPKGPSGKLIVVEGNRRLAALKLLLHPELRAELAERSEWDGLGTGNVPSKVPVIVAKTRQDVAPIIGYRHISGIQAWDAYAKARYIAAQLEEGRSFDETAKEVGERPADVRANYRNYAISEQARAQVSEETFEDLTDRFGVFTRAMQSADLREFVGAPAPNEVHLKKKPIPSAKKDELKELVGYLFGPESVVTDSRELTKLGKVISSAEGLKALRSNQTLEEAHIASGGVRDRLIERLLNAARSLRAAESDAAKYRKDEKIKELIEDCEEALEDVKRAATRAER